MQANLLAPIGESAAVGYGPAVSSKMIPSLLPRDNFWEVGAYRRVSRDRHNGRPSSPPSPPAPVAADMFAPTQNHVGDKNSS